MFTMEDLKPFFDKAKIEINGMTFRLTEDEDMVRRTGSMVLRKI